MDLLDLVNSRFGPRLGILLGRALSQNQSYRFVDWRADWFASREQSALYRAVRAKQAVMRDVPFDSEELKFLGRSVRLPVGHARLALKTGANILVGVC